MTSTGVRSTEPLVRIPLGLSLRRLATLVIPLAVVEWLVYPLLLHDSSRWWLSYIAYLAAGVILPGTLLAQAFLRWRADWLTWLGIGWALGHGLEVVAIQGAKVLGVPRLFLVWIPLAYLLAWRRRRWHGEVTAVTHPLRCVILFAVVVGFASATFVALNLNELSTQPYYQSDVWFHVNEAHEFRDHLDTADPRIAGRPYAYHTLEYGPSVGANLAVQVPLANLVTRYSGLSSVWLLVLLLFNSARHLRGPAAGFLSAALIVAPLDVFSLVSAKLSFGSSIIYSGLDLSTSTLVGFGALAGLFLPVRWLLLTGRFRDAWAVALLAYLAAGSKSVPGPLLLLGAGAVVGGAILQRHRPSRRSMVLVGVFALAFCATAVPILLRATVADSATVTFASVARLNPYAAQLLAVPEWLRLGVYPIGFCLLLWVGAVFGMRALAREGEGELCWFVGSALLASAVIAEAVSLPGHSELFFLYMAMVLMAPVAGLGLCHLGRLLWRGRRLATPVAALLTVLVLAELHLVVGGQPSAPLYDGSVWAHNLRNRIALGVEAYRRPDQAPSPSLGGPLLRVTPGMIAGLSWLRSAADSATAVIATNVPGAAIYAALCECREYFQTDAYAPESIGAARTHTVSTAFADRAAHLRAWMRGDAGSVEMLRRAGISWLIVDHLNGLPVSARDVPAPSFSNSAITIYRLR